MYIEENQENERNLQEEAQAKAYWIWTHRSRWIDPGSQTLDLIAQSKGDWTGFEPIRFSGLYICEGTGLFHLLTPFLSLNSRPLSSSLISSPVSGRKRPEKMKIHRNLHQLRREFQVPASFQLTDLNPNCT